MSDEPRLDEQAIAHAIEVGVSSQLDAAEELNVDIRTDLLKVVQGQADSISVSGKNLVVQPDIHVQEIELQTGSLSINPLKALLGHIELDQPTNTALRLKLTEADLNQAMNSDFVRSKFSPLELNVDGQPVTLEWQFPMELHLPEANKIRFSTGMLVHEAGNTRHVDITAVICPRNHEHPVLLQEFHCGAGQTLTLDFTIAFMHKMREIVNSPYLDFEGTAFRIKEMEVQPGNLVLQMEAQVRHLPAM